MYKNLDDIKKTILGLELNKRNQKNDYGDKFYYHLDSLFRFRLESNISENSTFYFNQSNYYSLIQFTFENSIILEHKPPQEIDWDTVDNIKDILDNRLGGLLKGEAKSDFLKPFRDFTLSSIEDLVIYEMAHPHSVFNPSLALLNILEKGYLFFASSDQNILKEYNKNLFRTLPNQDNLGLLTKTAHEKYFSGLITDNRYSIQYLVFEFLKENAQGLKNACSALQIIQHLKKFDKNITEQQLKSYILLPLKRKAIIGSNTNGYFFINSLDDIVGSYQHHIDKLEGIIQTLNVYDTKLRDIEPNIAQYFKRQITQMIN